MARPPALVLLGPAASGKSTVGAMVAARLGLAFVDLDAVGDAYYAEVGWSLERLARLSGEVGRVSAEREWEPARAHAVERVVQEHPGAVIALGAGHACFTRAAFRDRVRAALSVVPHVLLVLPSGNRAEALDELRRRSLQSKGTDWISGGHDFLAEWHDDEGMRALAHAEIITSAESPEATAGRIVARLGTTPAP